MSTLAKKGPPAEGWFWRRILVIATVLAGVFFMLRDRFVLFESHGPRPETPQRPQLVVKSYPHELSQPSKKISEQKDLEPNSRWEENWVKLEQQTPSLERSQALALALKELNSAAPKKAAESFLALHPTDRVEVVSDILKYTAKVNSDEAIHEAIRFCDLDPSYSLEYGRALISLLGGSGDYPSALTFVLTEETEGRLGENGNKWLNTLFENWGNKAPDQAAQAATDLVGPGLRGEALQAVASGWIKVDPAAAADYAWQLPESDARDVMLEVVLRSWSEKEPVAAGAWLDKKKIGTAEETAK